MSLSAPEWTIVITYAPRGALIAVGVARPQANSDREFYVILNDGYVWLGGIEPYAIKPIKHFATGTHIETRVDLVHNRVSFVIDGVAYGDAFGPIPNLGAMFPYVILRQADTRVDIVQSPKR